MNRFTRSFMTLALLLAVLAVHAVGDGETIRLINRGRSVMVENSTLDENKNAVLWTETNVNSQRWTLSVTTKGTYLLSNDYSGLYLAGLSSGTSGNVGQVTKTNANSRGSWELVPVEGTSNQYTIYQGTTRRYALAAPETLSDGSQLTIVNTQGTTPVSAERITWTVETVEPMARAFTADKRDAMMEGFKARHYKKQTSGYSIDRGGFWGDAEMFETVLDAYETTGDPQYLTMFDNLYTNFLTRNGSDWASTGQGWPRSNEYNDDIAWICIACTRGYLLSGQTKYRTTAKSNFDKMYKRANCYGNDLLQWKAYDNNTKEGTNACINGPAVVCACYLAIATADMSYYDKAIKTYAAHRNLLYEKSGGTFTGKVFDSGNAVNLTVGNTWASTYNEGTSLGAAILLYKYTGDEMYRKDADAINTWSKKNLANSRGIIHVCQTVAGDLCGFKGILLRYMRLYAEELGHPENYDWMAKNAYHAWNNRNSSGITSSAWLTKAEENFEHQEGNDKKTFEAFGNSTCLSAAFNCHLGVVDSHDPYAENRARDFNFIRNATVTAGEDGLASLTKVSAYVGYRRVDFGSQAASHIDLRTSISLASSGINVFVDAPDTKNGTLLCTIKGSDLEALKTMCDVRKMLNVPVTGERNIYFVSSGAAQINIEAWQFQKLNPVFADLTNGGGKLTTSLGGSADALTDGNVTTAFDHDMTAGSEVWIQYQSPSPMKIYAYQLFSGSQQTGDPKAWQLLGSDDGKAWDLLHEQGDTLFTVRAQRYTAEVSTEKSYRYVRMRFTTGETQSQFSLSEWQLLGRCIDQQDMTADGGTITEGFEPLIDHVGTTIVTAPIKAVYRPDVYKTLTAYSITIDQAAKAPSAWTLEGSANGTTWKVIDKREDESFPYDESTAIYRVDPGQPYLYYRLTIDGDEAEVSQWQLFGTPFYGSYYADLTEIADIKSCDGSDVMSLIDNDGGTYATIQGDSLYWDIQLPVPTRITGYSLVSADDAELDPIGVQLIAYDADGTPTYLNTSTLSFSARGTRITKTISTAKTVKRYQLLVTESARDKVRLADFELYGSGISEEGDACHNAPAKAEASAAALSTTETIAKVIDGSRTTMYRADFTQPVSITLTYDSPVRANAYGITASKSEVTRDPADWTLEGSNDGSSWTVIDQRSGELFSQRYATQFYFTEATESYPIYRLTVTAVNGGTQLQMAQLQMLTLDTDHVTEINTLPQQQRQQPQDDLIYDLTGRRIPGTPAKGLYIKGGRVELRSK